MIRFTRAVKALFVLAILASISASFADAASSPDSTTTKVTYIGAFGDHDYIATVTKAALQHTEKKYGKFSISTMPPVSKAKKENLIVSKPNLKRIAFTTEIKTTLDDPNFLVIPVPLMKGIVGFRVCFTSPKYQHSMNKITSVEPFRDYTFGVGKNWQDKVILDINGIKNIEVGYEFLVDEQINSLYEMTARGRVDVFCRGVNEVLREFDRHPAIHDLVMNESFTLNYEILFFLYLHKENRGLQQRLIEGFELIQNNGVFDALWREEFGQSVDFVKLGNRKVIEFRSEDIGIPRKQYQRYLYHPKPSKPVVTK